MERSLTLLLPVRNAQVTLSAEVDRILELMSDLPQKFELLIIDDGSVDATSEVAHELSQRYPQVRLLRHRTPQGREAAVRTGAGQGRGELIVLDEGSATAILTHMGRRWRRDSAMLRQGLPAPPPGADDHRTPAREPRRAHPPLGSLPARPNFLDRVKCFVWGE